MPGKMRYCPQLVLLALCTLLLILDDARFARWLSTTKTQYWVGWVLSERGDFLDIIPLR